MGQLVDSRPIFISDLAFDEMAKQWQQMLYI